MTREDDINAKLSPSDFIDVLEKISIQEQEKKDQSLHYRDKAIAWADVEGYIKAWRRQNG